MKNYTSLEKMKASDVAPSFTEEKVTAETFAQEVAKGTLYKGFEPPKDATMLKFRYYSPDGTLIEQNNVPVVYDGTGIMSVKTYYLLTDKSSGITLDSTGWDEKPQTVTKDKRFLWTYIKTIYTNKAYSCTEPCISAVFGEQGERGAMYLGHYANNQAAYEANKPAVFDGDYYLNTTDSYLYDYHKESNNWTPIKDFTDYRYNQSINDIFAAIEDSDDVKKFIKAKKIWVQHIAAAVARVETLYSNVIKLAQGTDLSDDKIKTGGLIQSANYDGTITNGAITKAGKNGWAIDYSGRAEFNNVTVRGTVDGSVINGSTINGGSITIGTNFSVDKDGLLIAENGKFRGSVDATDGSFDNCSINNCTIGHNVNFFGNIHSGPLDLTDETPAGSTKTFSSSDYLKNLYSYVKDTLKGYTYTGVIDGKDFDIISVNHYTKYNNSGDDVHWGDIKAYKEGSEIFSKTYSKTTSNIKLNIPVSITISMNSDAKVFKLKNLPTGIPEEVGTVYVKDGYLRIVT